MKVSSVAKEPLMHFFAGGVLLFVLYGFVNSQNPASPEEIVIDDTQVELLATGFSRTWQRQPSEAELQGLVEGWIREEIFYREGLAMRLDENDQIVRRRVAQKVEFIAEGLVGSSTQTVDAQQWLDDNADVYRLPARYSLRQVFFDPDRHGDDLETHIQNTLAGLESGSISEAGDPTMLPEWLDQMTADVVARTFGTEFSSALVDLQTAGWSGPIQSGFGAHLVYVESVVPSRTPTLEEVRDQVERDILRARTEESNQAFYESLRDKYSIIITADLLSPDAEL